MKSIIYNNLAYLITREDNKSDKNTIDAGDNGKKRNNSNVLNVFDLFKVYKPNTKENLTTDLLTQKKPISNISTDESKATNVEKCKYLLT
jgi:hypothetical protein